MILCPRESKVATVIFYYINSVVVADHCFRVNFVKIDYTVPKGNESLTGPVRGADMKPHANQSGTTVHYIMS